MGDEEVVRFAKKLERIVNGDKAEDGALDILKALQKIPVNLETLQKTRIGMTINDLRKKTDNSELQSTAKALIRDWKKMLEAGKSKNGSSKPTGLPRNDSTASGFSEAGESNDGSQSTSSKSGSQGAETPRQKQFPAPKSEPDSVRDKCRQMIENSLKDTGELPDGTLDPEDIAERIEAELCRVHKGTSDKYKAAVRSRVFNLRDKKNPDLRANVLTGVVKAELFAVMTSEEMASDAMKNQRVKYTKEAINDHQMSVQDGTPTDMFKCGKCKKKNCTYTQVQTRSADEPMTTFVFCRECGNRWKFC